MAITFSSPEDQPYGCFANDAPYVGFHEDGAYWPSVEHYIQAKRFASPEDIERIRAARTPADAIALGQATAGPLVPDWELRARAVMLHAVQRKFEANLGLRALLVGTFDEPIEAHLADPERGTGPDGAGRNELGRILEEVRAVVRRRAQDGAAVQCEHQDASEIGLACEHLIDNRGTVRRYYRRFTGQGTVFDAVCPACRSALVEREPPLRKLCSDCFEAFLNGYREGDLGSPAIRERPTPLDLAYEVVHIEGLPQGPLADLQPMQDEPGAFLALTRAGELLRVDLGRRAASSSGRLPDAAVDMSGEINLRPSRDGRLAAVVEAHGRRGVVLELGSGRVRMELLRDDYHIKHTRFPVAFFELDGRLLLAHGTAWNRLDVSDPWTGLRLTERGPTSDQQSEPRADHGLDYFHGALLVSPDGEWVIDNGWVWAPFGIVRTFSLRRWVDENLWESEDGASGKDLCARGYYWDGPVCWLDARTVAVWGLGDDDLLLAPGVRVFDVGSGEELRSFSGPAEGLVFDEHLFSFAPAHGISAWDVITGDRIRFDPGFCPSGYHPGARCFFALEQDGSVRIARLVST
jgi:ribA/ribD-fused uncharacterized protein